MLVLKNKPFDRWAKDINLQDAHLLAAVKEMMHGLYDANLGGNIYKKRIAIAGRGKRGGVRTIVAFKKYDVVIFIYGFAKNKRDTISDKEEEALKELAKLYFSYDEMQLKEAIQIGELREIQS
jgi:hypothetical protein